MVKHVLGLLAAAAILAALAGCGGKDGPETVVVRGKVSYAGQAVEDGLIRFTPIEGTKGPANTAVIREGRYELSGRGGVPAGTHRVDIRAFRKTPDSEQSDDDVPAMRQGRAQLLPAKYNSRSTLQITVPPGSRTLDHDFELAP